MISKKYAVLALLGMGALLVIPMADAVRETWLGVDCTTLKAGMVPICGDLNILKDLHISPLESDVQALQIIEETELKMAVTVLETPDGVECTGAALPQIGWCPNPRNNIILIEDPLITESSFVMVKYKSTSDFDFDACIVVNVSDGEFTIDCDYLSEDSSLSYIIIQ